MQLETVWCESRSLVRHDEGYKTLEPKQKDQQQETMIIIWTQLYKKSGFSLESKKNFCSLLVQLTLLCCDDERLGVCTWQLFLSGLQQQPGSSDPGFEQQHWFQK